MPFLCYIVSNDVSLNLMTMRGFYLIPVMCCIHESEILVFYHVLYATTNCCYFRSSCCNRRHPWRNLRQSNRSDTRAIGSNDLDTSQRKTLKHDLLVIFQTLWILLKHKWRVPRSIRFHRGTELTFGRLRAILWRTSSCTAVEEAVVDLETTLLPEKKLWLHSLFMLISYPVFCHRLPQYHTACFPWRNSASCIVNPQSLSFCCNGITNPVSPRCVLYENDIQTSECFAFFNICASIYECTFLDQIF